MRLSEIKGERVFDVIADLIEPVARIAEDKEAAKLFRREKLSKGETAMGALLKRIRAFAPDLLRNHKGELIEIMATLQGVSKDDYVETLTCFKLPSDIISLLNDSELLAFFGLAQTTEAPSSGAAQGNTQAAEV